jgi:hypothetical protein
MEANILADGFGVSLKLHDVIYHKFIGDGDSSVYAKILNANPYGDDIIKKKKKAVIIY